MSRPWVTTRRSLRRAKLFGECGGALGRTVCLMGIVALAGICPLGMASGQAFAQSSTVFFLAKNVVEVRAGQEIVGKVQPGERVEATITKGEWIGIKSPLSGWIPRQQLIEPAQALEHFTTRLQENPQDQAAAIGRARAWIQQSEKQLGQAAQEWSETLKRAPNEGDAYLRRARVWRKMKLPDRAIADLDMAIKVTPFSAAAYQELAEVLLERGDHRRAIANYGEVIRLRPWQAQPHADRAWAYHLAGDQESAMSDMEIARRLNPQDAQIWYRLALIALAGKGSFRTKDFLTQAITLDPLLAGAYLARAALQRGPDKDRLALQDYNTAIHLNPQSLEAYSARGNFYLKIGQYDHALRDLTHVVELNSRQAEAFFDRGKIYLDREESELAVADLERAAELNPLLLKKETAVFVSAYRQRAEQNIKAKRFDLAAADYSAALKITPTDLELVSARGQAYLAHRDYSQGIADLSRVANAQTEDAASWFALAHAWYLAGQYSRAAVEYRKAILVEPSFVPAYTNLAWMLATCPKKEFRNGKLAVRYATYACELTGWKQYAILDTLAAAEAEAGNFHEAIKWQSAVVYLAPPEERAEFQQRLELYGGLKPYYEQRLAEAGITTESDIAGVLVAKDDSVADFAKSLGLPLPNMAELTAANPPKEPPLPDSSVKRLVSQTLSPDLGPPPAIAEAKEPQPKPPITQPISQTNEPTAETKVAETKVATEPPTVLTPVGPDDPKAVAELKSLGAKSSLRLGGQVQSLGLQYTKFADKDAKLLAGVPSLEILDLTFTPIGEPTFKQLGQMKRLKLLVLDQTKITDDLLANLAELPNLEVLSLKATSISGKGLKHLEQLPKLNMILINGTRVTGAEIEQYGTSMPKVKLVR